MSESELLHNAKAGAGKYSRKRILKLLEKHGLDCRYYSTKGKTWKNFEAQDLLVIAGGDGTVRKVCKEILKRPLLESPQRLAILPLGTANNIARALGLDSNIPKMLNALGAYRAINYDVGLVSGLSKERFFIESLGFGPLAYLIEVMEQRSKRKDNPAKSIRTARKKFFEIIKEYPLCSVRVKIDGKDYSGEYAMVEIMNVPAVGPSLSFSPASDPADGYFEVVLVNEDERDKVQALASGRSNGRAKQKLNVVRGRMITISTSFSHMHIDDKVINMKPGRNLTIELKNGLLNFLAPAKR